MDDIFRLLKRPDHIWLIIPAISGIFAPWIRKGKRKAKSRLVRDWPCLPAAIDVVSAAERHDDKKHYYAAVLTYFYRRPDLQIGEYEREFPTKAAALDWVKQFKGSSVMVHVNPKDAADSFLLESDLEGLETHRTASESVPADIETPPTFPPSYRFISALGEALCLAGLATCAVLFAVSFTHGGKMHQPWFLWAGGAIFVLTILFMYAVQFHVHFTESHNFLSNYKHWTPTWMRWMLHLSIPAFVVLLILSRLHFDPATALQQWMDRLAPSLPYLLASWSFLFGASFYTAIQRSQEQVRLPVK